MSQKKSPIVSWGIPIAVILAAVLTLILSGCGTGDTGKSTLQEMKLTEDNHQRLIKAVPPPRLTTSAERINIKRRLERWNDENKLSYIYLIDKGIIVANFVVKGKVSSVNSKLTTQQQIIEVKQTEIRNHTQVVESPALDGSYGTNGDAIFFFIANGAYVEWSGTYLLFDKPMTLSQKPLLLASDS